MEVDQTYWLETQTTNFLGLRLLRVIWITHSNNTFKDGLIPQNEIQEHLSRQNSLDTLPVEDNDELISLDYQRGQTYDELFQKQMSDLSVLSDNKSDNEGDQQQAQEEPKPVSTPKKVRKFDSIEEVRKSLKNKGELLKKLHEDASKIIE